LDDRCTPCLPCELYSLDPSEGAVDLNHGRLQAGSFVLHRVIIGMGDPANGGELAQQSRPLVGGVSAEAGNDDLAAIALDGLERDSGLLKGGLHLLLCGHGRFRSVTVGIDYIVTSHKSTTVRREL